MLIKEHGVDKKLVKKLQKNVIEEMNLERVRGGTRKLEGGEEGEEEEEEEEEESGSAEQAEI